MPRSLTFLSWLVRKVYAVEYTDMAKHARTLVEKNGFGEVIEVIQGSAESIVLPEKVPTDCANAVNGKTVPTMQNVVRTILLLRRNGGSASVASISGQCLSRIPTQVHTCGFGKCRR